MEVIWFCLVAMMLTGYVILDGFDIGAGIMQLLAARTKEERAQVLKTIGPYWDGNEVWLVAGGGTLYFAFPALYSSSFSGFYLPLMMVLWLLMLRGISIELRNHIESPVWQPFWDAGFGLSSALLAIFFGAAIGNVVRGVPLGKEGEFFLPLWTHWGIEGNVGILDWFTLLTGALAFSALAMHGALWIYLKTSGPLQVRMRQRALLAAAATAILTLAVTVASFRIQPQIMESFAARPWGVCFPALAMAGIGMVFYSLRAERERQAFLASGAYLLGMMTSVAFGLFPLVLPSNTNPSLSLTIYNSAAADYGLRVGLAWWLPGMALAFLYSFFLYRRFAGKLA